MRQLRIGILGFGDGGQSSAQAIGHIARAKVVAVHDIDPARLLEIGKYGSGIGAHLDLADFLAEDMQLVIIATPDNVHYKVALAALEAGHDIFVEKPVATTVEDIILFRRLAAAYPGQIYYSENHSFTPQVEAALSRLDELGGFLVGNTVYSLRGCNRIMGGGKWRTEHAYNPAAGGLSHNFTTAQLFSGSPIAWVQARGMVATYNDLEKYGGFDTMLGTLEFKSGALMTFTVCLAIRGEHNPDGMRPIDHKFYFRNGYLAYGPDPESDRLKVGNDMIDFAPEASGDAWLAYFLDYLYRRMHEDVINSILDGTPPRHTFDHGLNTAAACLAAFTSAQQGGVWIKV